MAPIIGIRREDKNKWERRVPLTPSHIKELKHAHDIDFIVSLPRSGFSPMTSTVRRAPWCRKT